MIDYDQPSDGLATRRSMLRLGAAVLAGGRLLSGTHAARAFDPASVSGPDDIPGLDATSLSAAIASKTVSCVEVMSAYLARIDALNGSYNAIVSRASTDRLMAQAAVADRELSQGRYRGWMHGMPHAVKDLADLKGFVNSSGSRIFADNVSTADSLFVERIRKAGAIFIGKTNAPEWGLGSQTYNDVFGATGNAYDPELTAGGSSGGAASALATHMLPVADGSDMMGSLRNPAAFNNVIGFRPSQGLIPGDDADLFYRQLATDGPMGRSVRDVARLLQTMAGYDARDPLSSRETLRLEGLKPLDPKTVSIGWLGDYEGYLPMESGLLALCEASLTAVGKLGLDVDDCRVDFSPAELWATWLTLRHWAICSGAKALYDDESTRALMKPELIWEIEGGLNLTAADMSSAARRRSNWYRSLLPLFERYDFIALPTTQVFPFSRELHWPKTVAGQSMDTYHRWMEVVIGGTLSGCPVINLPAGFDPRGRPAGIQVIAPMGQDAKLLAFGLTWELCTDYLQQRPDGNRV